MFLGVVVVGRRGGDLGIRSRGIREGERERVKRVQADKTSKIPSKEERKGEEDEGKNVEEEGLPRQVTSGKLGRNLSRGGRGEGGGGWNIRARMRNLCVATPG